MGDAYELELIELLFTVVRALVERPEDVRIGATTNEAMTVFTIEANPCDLGKLIGANGRTARALRVIVGASAAKLNRSLSIKIASAQESGIPMKQAPV